MIRCATLIEHNIFALWGKACESCKPSSALCSSRITAIPYPEPPAVVMNFCCHETMEFRDLSHEHWSAVEQILSRSHDQPYWQYESLLVNKTLLTYKATKRKKRSLRIGRDVLLFCNSAFIPCAIVCCWLIAFLYSQGVIQRDDNDMQKYCTAQKHTILWSKTIINSALTRSP